MDNGSDLLVPEALEVSSYDGVARETLRETLGVPGLAVYAQIRSTFDAAHAMAAAGAPAGTLILADTQTAGRGRNGRVWSSPTGQGVWLTLIERPTDRLSIEVLSLRIGLAAAAALDGFVSNDTNASKPVLLKWPNDLYLGDKKLGGILVEARWRDERPEWVAIGLGINMTPPVDQPKAAGLAPGLRRSDVLSRLVPALRSAASATGLLTSDELAEYGTRDMAHGRQCLEPLNGRVAGITASGELLVELADSLVCVRSGSLVLE